MANLSTAEQIEYEQMQAQQVPRQVESREAGIDKSLTTGEKAAFGVAAIFSAAILIALIFLTVMGFIFSPAMDTLVMALLTGATGVTTYVIWKGGKRNA